MIRNLVPHPVDNADRSFMRKAGLLPANSLTIAAAGVMRGKGLPGARPVQGFGNHLRGRS